MLSKKIKLFTIISAILITLPGLLNAQKMKEESSIDNLIKSKHTYKVNYSYDEIEGTPYLQKEFTEGIFHYKNENKDIKKPLRYNMFTEKFEMQRGELVYVLNREEKVEHIKYLGK